MSIVGNDPGPDQKVVPTLLTWPNLITLVRFMGVPVFVWLILAEKDILSGFWVLMLLGSTDWIDGFLARRLHQVSKWGQVLDPLADRFSLVVIAMTLVVAGIAPWWLFLSLLIPDVVIFVFGLVWLKAQPELHVTYMGKVRTALLLAGVPLLVLSATEGLKDSPLGPVALALLAAGCLGHWVAGCQYMGQSLNTYRRRRGNAA